MTTDAMDAYLAAGQPGVCPRCGDWDGPDLPSCVGPEGHREDICSRVFYADDVCRACDDAMADEAQADTEGRA